MQITFEENLRLIPKVDLLLAWPEIMQLSRRYSRKEVKTSVQSILGDLRRKIKNGLLTSSLPSREELIEMISQETSRISGMNLRPVINGTGVVMHTNLGRSPIAEEVYNAVRSVATGYSNLEFDLSEGERGSRGTHTEALISELTGAESAMIVNNNAAAVMLAISSLANGREAVVSRGELVEIGGAFRIPDVMHLSGARMVEVGTTNCTHLTDYLSATTEMTALYLKVHTSNFLVSGFTTAVSVHELAGAAAKQGIPLMVDAGSGSILDLSRYGIGNEPSVRQLAGEGADIVTFSGDKLLGGAQGGIIVGRRELLEPMKKHPLARAFRIDKLSLAIIEATLRLYRDEARAMKRVPTLRMLGYTYQELEKRSARMVRILSKSVDPSISFARMKGESTPGSGAFPLLKLPTSLIEIKFDGASPGRIESALRKATVPVIARISHNRCLIDSRTIADSEIGTLADSLNEAASFLKNGDA